MIYIKTIEIRGLFGKFDAIIENLQPGINILHGDNGCGKTTLLHVIANILNCDYGRLLLIKFNYIKIEFNNNILFEFFNDSDLILSRTDIKNKLNISSQSEGEPLEDRIKAANKRSQRFTKLISTAYFPAFRGILEAWDFLQDTTLANTREASVQFNNWSNNITNFSRKVFGGFVPALNYSSPNQISRELFQVFKNGKQKILEYNQEILSGGFQDILSSSLDDLHLENIELKIRELLSKIKATSQQIEQHPLQTGVNLIDGLEDKISRAIEQKSEEETTNFLSKRIIYQVLLTYHRSLEDIVNFQNSQYKPIEEYLDLINSMFSRKVISINLDVANHEEAVDSEKADNFLNVLSHDRSKMCGIQNLSSGEKQLFTLLYAIVRSNEQEVILIDEPEISIHIDKQIELLQTIAEIASGKQIVVCTHSPTIAGEHLDRLREVELLETDTTKWKFLSDPLEIVESDHEDDYFIIFKDYEDGHEDASDFNNSDRGIY